MPKTSADVYSMFECDQLALKVAGDNEYTRDDCVGKITIERETKTVTKKCRGVTKKRKTKPTGNGTITVSLHIKLALYRKINAMTNKGLQPGVYGFSNIESLMPEVSIAARVMDEDDEPMFLGFPRCKVEEINSTEIENGGEEVAEVEMKLSYMPDDNGIGEYQALAAELTGEVLNADNWMTSFSSELAQASDTSSNTETGTETGTGTNP